MPRYDGTGPNGQGAKTGRGLGYCNTEDEQEVMDYGRRLGKGNRSGFSRGVGNFGRGRGVCRQRVFCSSYDINEEDSLKREKDVLEERIKYINRRIDELGKTEETL